MATKSYSLAHTKWMCKYHIVFTPKYRRKEIYNQVRRDLIEIFERIFMGYLKGKSSLMIFEKHAQFRIVTQDRLSISYLQTALI